jgi:hypothetical protein
VYGRFVISGGLKFESFDRNKNTVEAHPLPRSWHVYVGIDYGSGGERGHPAAIVFVGVSPDFKQGRVFKAWRGDGQVTSSPTILDKLEEMRGNLTPVLQVYDYSAKDLFTIASSRNIALTPADKKQDAGTDMLNSLFKNEMIKIQRGDPECEKLCIELTSLLKNTSKTSAHDNLCDALRYVCKSIPWDWTAIDDYLARQEKDVISEQVITEETPEERRMRERRGDFGKDSLDPIEQEILGWNDLYES